MSGTTGLLKKSISSIVTLVVGLGVFLSIPSQIALFGSEGAGSVNARTVPYLITALIVLISVIMIVAEALKARNESPAITENDLPEKTSYGRVILAFLAIAAWIAALPVLGFNLSTILLVATVMVIIGNCKWWQIVVLSFALSFHVLLFCSVSIVLRF